MPAKFWPAPEVASVSGPLIQLHHKHLIMNDVMVHYLFTDEAPKKGGKERVGLAEKVTGRQAWMMAGMPRQGDEYPDNVFVMTIFFAAWRSMSEAQREALVDHELCHFYSDEDEDGNLKLSIRPHDVEEFKEVIDRHGLWEFDVRAFAAACAKYTDQLDLWGSDPEAVERITA